MKFSLIILFFVLISGSGYGQSIGEVREFTGYVGMSNDSILSEGRRFNDFMLENEGNLVHINITMDYDQNDGYANGRTKIFYFFAVYDDDDRLSGSEYHIMLDGRDDVENDYLYNANNMSIEGYFEIGEITGPQNGLLSVDMKPVVVKEMR